MDTCRWAPYIAGSLSRIDEEQLVLPASKQTFIEVVIPPCEKARRRCMSDSALPDFEKPDKPWKTSPEKLQDISDTSTNVSLEMESEENGAASLSSNPSSEILSSEEEGFAAPPLPYHCAESWWLSTGCGGSTPSYEIAASVESNQVRQSFHAFSFAPMRTDCTLEY